METTAGTWQRSSWSDAGQIVALIDPDREDGGAAGQPLHAWYGELRGAGKLREAVEFVAHALPRYECVVWATRSLIELGAVDRHDPLMLAVLRWIDDPRDRQRRAAADLADATRKDSPALLLARAVHLSGGSLAPEDLPPIQPAPDVCAKMAGAAVLSGAYLQADPQAALMRALELGNSIASGT